MWSGWRTVTAGSEQRSTVWLGLGTNLGERRSNLAAALARLSSAVIIEAVSNVYESEPIGFTDQPVFWNLVARARTALGPDELLVTVKQVEAALGRRPAIRWGPRLIDIDILLYDDLVTSGREVEIPHPRMLERAFVLRPLVEIDPELYHPRTGTLLKTVLAEGKFEQTHRRFPGSELLPHAG